jgi:hypothetical protein
MPDSPERPFIPPRKPHGIEGLGDVVHIIAGPAAKVIDGMLGTDWQHCPECAERRKDWNEKFPLRRSAR